MDLAIAKAVITGGASGLGFATAQRVVAAGGHWGAPNPPGDHLMAFALPESK